MDTISRLVAIFLAALAVLAGVSRAADVPARPGAGQAAHQTLYAQLEKTDAVHEGFDHAGHVLYVFFDANCFYCRITWKALQPYETAGLQVRWVPVAYQQPSSLNRAAAIMQARDRRAALRKNETDYDPDTFSGGIRPLDKVPERLAAQLNANTLLMQRFGAPGTPALVWKDPGGSIRFKLGVPKLAELPQITGLPAQVVDDPELERFR